ncbi:hypothetical protein Tco_0540691 [Tanacetum coccineum]
MHTARGDGLTGIKRRHRDPSSDDVRKMTTTSGSGRLKEDLESYYGGLDSFDVLLDDEMCVLALENDQ